MSLLYSETLYSFYLNHAKAIQIFYVIVFLWALYNFKFFVGTWKLFFAYISLSFLTEFVVYRTPIADMENNHFIGHISFFLGTILIGSFIYATFASDMMKRVSLFSTIFLCFAVIFGFFYNQGYLMPSPMGPVIYVVFLVLHLILQRKLIAESKINQLRESPLFWWNISFIIMHVVYIIFSLTIGYILPISDDLSFIWYIIKNTFDPITCILWMISIYKLRNWKFKPTASLSPSL
jgi:hypothetical protein